MDFSRARALAPLLVLLAFPFAADADEPIFAYTYTTDILPKNKWEFEQWTTLQYKQSQGSYAGVLMRSELEYGVTNNFQVSLYLNYSYLNANNNAVGGGTSGLNIPANQNPNEPFHATRWDGVSTEFTWRLLSPYKDVIGLALYLEPEFGPRERGIEGRVILQKNFLDDRLVLAANFWVEYERENQAANPYVDPSDPAALGGVAKDTMAEFDLGVSYRFASNWAGGIEFRNHNEFDGWTLSHGSQGHSAFFVGPNLHYAAQKWFFTLTALKQVKAITYTDEQKAATVGGKIYGDEHTLYDGIRLKVGYLF